MDLELIELVSALPLEMSSSLLSSRIGIQRLDAAFTSALADSFDDNGIPTESSKFADDSFIAVNYLYSRASSVSLAYSRWALCALWDVHLKNIHQPKMAQAGLLEVGSVMLKCLTHFLFANPQKFEQESAAALTRCLEKAGEGTSPPAKPGVYDFLVGVVSQCVDEDQENDGILVSSISYHASAILAAAGDESTSTLHTLLPSLISSFTQLAPLHVPLVFALITRTVLLHVTEGGQDCLQHVLRTSTTTSEPSTMSQSRPLTANRDPVSRVMWEKAFAHCPEDAFDLVFALVKAGGVQVDRYLVQNCASLVMQMLVSSADSGAWDVASRCFAVLVQGVFSSVLFAGGKRARKRGKMDCLGVVEVCLRDRNVAARRWACQLLYIGAVEKADADALAVVDRVQQVLKERDSEDVMFKYYANKCVSVMPDALELAEQETQWLKEQVQGTKFSGLAF